MFLRHEWWNLVQYIFDFKSVDSTAQMASSTEMTLLDVKVPTQGLATKTIWNLNCLYFIH